MDDMSTVSTKGDSVVDHIAYVQMYLKNKDILWKEMLKKRWARQRIGLYGGKKRIFANFFNAIQNGGDEQDKSGQTRRVVVAFGSEKFAPGGRNELSVPTTRAYNECRYRFPTIPIDEFRTTRVYSKDDSILGKVGYKGINVAVRGLLWCSSTNNGKFVNRDLNAALNIRRCATGPRPEALTRTHGLVRLSQNIEKRICQSLGKRLLEK